MNFSIKFISTFLSGYITSSKTDSSRWCIEKVMLSDLRDCSDNSILYIGQSADGSIVCINRGCRITVYDAPLFDVFNTISSRMQYYNDWELRAIRAAAASRDFQDCVDLFYELFPGYIIRILDATGRMMYTNSDVSYATMEPLFLKLIRGIPACHKIALGIKGTHLFWSEHFQRHLIFGNFVFDDGAYLFFSIRERDEPLTDAHIQLSQLAQDIFEKTNYRKFDLVNFTPYTDMFRRILDGHTPEPAETAGLENLIDWRIYDGAYLVLIECSPDDSFSAKALSLSIADKISSAFSFSYESEVVCMLPENMLERNLETLREIVSSLRFRAGVSLRINTWADLSTAYRQSKLMLSSAFSRGSTPVVFCKDYMWQYFIRLFDTVGGRQMQHPDIALLRAVDEAKGSQLLDTLYCYLVNCCSMSKTAEYMHLHISTLKYRMAKITELISFDPEDYANRMVFLLSYDILKLPEANSHLNW